MRHRSNLLITIAALGAAPLIVPIPVQSTQTAGLRPESSGRPPADPAGQYQWPRFRGPSSNPISDNPNLPVSWSKTENVEWVADLPGVGWSSPVVWGSRVFLTAATSDTPMKPPSLGVDYSNDYLAELRKQGLSAEAINKKLYERDREMPDEIVISLMLYCYDLETGKQLWERQLYHGRPAGGRHSKNSFASETPTTDGERVYVYLTDYGLFAYDFQGKPSWATPLTSHATTRDWGTGASAALHKDRLFVLNDNEEQSFVAAFDTRTGKELWRTPRTVQPARKTGWSTPFVWENRVRTELVTLGPAVAISYSLDGRELWRLNRMGGVAIQSPFAWNDFLFVTSGSGGDDNRPIVAVRAGGSGDITPPDAETHNEHVVWYDRRVGGTYLPTPVIYRNALYVLNDKGIFSRHNAETGERIYQSRVAPGASAFTASPWAYSGHVFVMSEEGDTFVIEAADEYRLVRVNSLDDFSMATPAIVGDRLLIRTQHRLYSIRNSPQGAPPSDAFVLVRGPHYEGAIIPASSSWHRSLWNDPAIRNELKVADVWTPSESQVAAAEGALQTFVEGALKENASTKPTSSFKQVLVRGDIRSLAENLKILKRQYGGILLGTERMILVHGFPDDPARRWQTEAIMILGNACRQFWMDFNVPQQRVTKLRCGGLD